MMIRYMAALTGDTDNYKADDSDDGDADDEDDNTQHDMKYIYHCGKSSNDDFLAL